MNFLRQWIWFLDRRKVNHGALLNWTFRKAGTRIGAYVQVRRGDFS